MGRKFHQTRTVATGVAGLALAVASATAAIGQGFEERVLTERFRIGGVDVPEHEAFAMEPELVVDASGRLYALSRTGARVSIFDGEGRFLRSVGRAGAGPGEFEAPVAHGLLGDTLWVRNWPTPRFSFFDAAGEHLETERIDLGGGAAGAPRTLSRLLPGGHALSVRDAVPAGTSARLRVPILLGDRQMSRPDTLGGVPLPRGLYIPGVGSWAYAPFPLPALYGVAPDGSTIAVADWDSADPEVVSVRVYGADGALEAQKALRLVPARVPDAVVSAVLAEGVGKAEGPVRTARAGGAPGLADLEEAVRAGLVIPDRYPPIQDLVVGIDGTIWLRRMTGPGEGPWLVLSREGDPLFRVRVPRGFGLRQASASAVWGTAVGELDVPLIIAMDVNS